MASLNAESLADTIDAVNESFFYGKPMTDADRLQIARWIASRVGKPGSYFGLAAPVSNDFKNGIRTFTGEWIRSKAGKSHVLGEEACRVLILLNDQEPEIMNALKRATQSMIHRLMLNESSGEIQGLYCCGTCSASYWRHVAVGGLDKNEARLTAAMKVLKSLRTGDGRWRRFPFSYTILALSDMDNSLTSEEIRYAAPVIERHLKRSTEKDEYSKRRKALYERILAKC